MKKVILLGLFLVTILGATAQNVTDSIEVKKGFGTVYRQNGNNLTPRQLLEITKIAPEAYEAMKVAKTNYDVGAVFGFAGGFLVGWPLGTAIAGGEPNWALAGIGAGLVGVSIPFTVAYNKHAKKAVSIYNNSLKNTTHHNVNLKVGLTAYGVGIKMTF